MKLSPRLASLLATLPGLLALVVSITLARPLLRFAHVSEPTAALACAVVLLPRSLGMMIETSPPPRSIAWSIGPSELALAIVYAARVGPWVGGAAASAIVVVLIVARRRAPIAYERLGGAVLFLLAAELVWHGLHSV